MSDTILVKKNTIRRFLPIPSIIAGLIVVFLFYSFVVGWTYQFYASALFLFYALTKSMWVSVMMLGVFQTILLIPLRVVRIIKQNNIHEFQKKITSIQKPDQKQQSFKENVSTGNLTFLFYVVDFVIQLVSFVTLGRLFLTDFYSIRISPTKLYSFVPYPDYPILDTWFKIPYPDVTKTVDLGLRAVLVVWLVLIVIQVFIYVVRLMYRSSVKKGSTKLVLPRRLSRYATGYLLIGMLVSYYVMRHFPVEFDLAIFTGDVSVPNRQLNLITALSTFFMILWFGIPKIIRKGRLAEEAGVEQSIVEKTQKSMLGDTLKNAVLLGVGAYLITNQIPSAFELSIFTLEVISLASPLTLDRFILATLAKPKVEEAEVESVAHDEN